MTRKGLSILALCFVASLAQAAGLAAPYHPDAELLRQPQLSPLLEVGFFFGGTAVLQGATTMAGMQWSWR